MPLIIIRRNPARIPDAVVRHIIADLPQVAADALSTKEGGKLIVNNIMIWVENFGEFDTNTKDIRVLVFAHDYAERRANLDAQREKIDAPIKRQLPAGTSGSVWLLLAPTSFGAFQND